MGEDKVWARTYDENSDMLWTKCPITGTINDPRLAKYAGDLVKALAVDIDEPVQKLATLSWSQTIASI